MFALWYRGMQATMKPRSLNEVLSTGGQKHLLVGDAFIERYGLGGDLGWIYDELIPLDEEYFHELMLHRNEMALERILEKTTLLAVITVKDRIVRRTTLRRLTRDCYPGVLVFLDRFDSFHSPTLMPMIEMMSARVLELNLKREHDIELLDLANAGLAEKIQTLDRYRENCPEAVGAPIHELRDLEAFEMLTCSLDIRHYGGKQSRHEGDERAFGSKLVYSLKKYDWRPGNYTLPEGPKTWLCQPLEKINGDFFMLANDYLSLEDDDRVCELINNNDSLTELNIITRDDRVITLDKKRALYENQLSLRNIIDARKSADEKELAVPSLADNDVILAVGGVR